MFPIVLGLIGAGFIAVGLAFGKIEKEVEQLRKEVEKMKNS